MGDVAREWYVRAGAFVFQLVILAGLGGGLVKIPLSTLKEAGLCCGKVVGKLRSIGDTAVATRSVASSATLSHMAPMTG